MIVTKHFCLLFSAKIAAIYSLYIEARLPVWLIDVQQNPKVFRLCDCDSAFVCRCGCIPRRVCGQVFDVSLTHGQLARCVGLCRSLLCEGRHREDHSDFGYECGASVRVGYRLVCLVHIKKKPSDMKNTEKNRKPRVW